MKHYRSKCQSKWEKVISNFWNFNMILPFHNSGRTIGLKLADCIISLGKIFIMDYICCWAIVVAVVFPVAMAVVGQ